MNSFNYVRERSLLFPSIEFFAILAALAFFWYLHQRREGGLEVAYFLCLPFSDIPFRVASVQPVEAVSLLIILLHYRKIRLNFVVLIAALFLIFSVIGYLTGSSTGFFSLGYSLRFLLTALVFSIFLKSGFGVPPVALRFMVVFCFTLTALQIALWLAGLPIHGVFFDLFFPRAKGLAQEPATWSVWILALMPYILHFRLGRSYLLLNLATLVMTFSTLGFLAIFAFFLLRLFFTGVRLRLTAKRLLAGAVLVPVLLLTILAAPSVLNQATRYFSFLDKLVYYEYEISEAANLNLVARPTGLTVGESGRGSDLRLFQETFPEHWLVGIGSFNAATSDTAVVTNTYLAFLVELGVTGAALLALLLCLHYGVLLRHCREKSPDFLAFSLTFLLMIAGIRCFAFHELWYAQANLLRLSSERRESEAEEEILHVGGLKPAA